MPQGCAHGTGPDDEDTVAPLDNDDAPEDATELELPLDDETPEDAGLDDEATSDEDAKADEDAAPLDATRALEAMDALAGPLDEPVLAEAAALTAGPELPGDVDEATDTADVAPEAVVEEDRCVEVLADGPEVPDESGDDVPAEVACEVAPDMPEACELPGALVLAPPELLLPPSRSSHFPVLPLHSMPGGQLFSSST